MNKVFEKEQIIPFIHNALSTYVDSDGFVRFKRFTDSQIEQYKKDSAISNSFYEGRAYASANIVFEANTDSSYIAFLFRWIGFGFLLNNVQNAKVCEFDILVDNCFYDSFLFNRDNVTFWSFNLPEGMHNVKLVFPWSAEIKLESVRFSSGSVVNPVVEKDLRIICFGDSITQGYISNHPAMSYVGQLTTKLNAEVLNQGVGGYFFEQDSLDEKLSLFNPDVVTIAYGTNDYSLFTEDYNKRVNSADNYIKKILSVFPNAKIVGILPIHSEDPRLPKREQLRDTTLDEWRNVLAGIYAKYDKIEILKDSFFPHLKDCFASDGIHPNDLGFCFYANAVIEKIKAL